MYIQRERGQERERYRERERGKERDPREPSSDVVQKVYTPGLSTLRFPVNTIAKLVDGRFCTCAESVLSFILRILVSLVIYDSGYVSRQHLLLSRYPPLYNSHISYILCKTVV